MSLPHQSHRRTDPIEAEHKNSEVIPMTKRLLTGLAFMLAFSPLISSVRADDKARDNAQARLEAARKVYQGILDRAKVDPTFQQTAIESLNLWSRRWLEAQRELSDKKEDRIAAAADHLERMKKLQADVTASKKGGLGTAADVAAADFYCLEAEQWLTQAGG
jgi:hypothetical protein